jgi:hypothetical protein
MAFLENLCAMENMHDFEVCPIAAEQIVKRIER